MEIHMLFSERASFVWAQSAGVDQPVIHTELNPLKRVPVLPVCVNDMKEASQIIVREDVWNEQRPSTGEPVVHHECRFSHVVQIPGKAVHKADALVNDSGLLLHDRPQPFENQPLCQFAAFGMFMCAEIIEAPGARQIA